MTEPNRIGAILMADDDPDDREMAARALGEARVGNPVDFVTNGIELLDYLEKRPPFEEKEAPVLVLLDLNMPKLDGRAALSRIKENPELRKIPIVVLTTSRAHEDVLQSYDIGANSFISKPVTFEGLVEVMKTLGEYWFNLVRLPAREA